MVYICEVDKFKSYDNKQDLIHLITRYHPKRYKKKDFKNHGKKQLQAILGEIK